MNNRKVAGLISAVLLASPALAFADFNETAQRAQAQANSLTTEQLDNLNTRVVNDAYVTARIIGYDPAEIQTLRAEVAQLRQENAQLRSTPGAAVGAPANPADMLRQIDIQANAIADEQIARITTDSKNAYVEALNKGASTTAALAAADAAAAAAIDAMTTDTSRIVVAGYINHGRATVFDLNSKDLYALQRSEVLDNRTCNYCLSVDARVIETGDAFGQNTIFHSGCRGIWVAILQDEEEKPKIAGIPQSIRDRFGDTVNDLIQPRKSTRKSAPYT